MRWWPKGRQSVDGAVALAAVAALVVLSMAAAAHRRIRPGARAEAQVSTRDAA